MKNIYTFGKICLFAITFLFVHSVISQTTVSSIPELVSYLNQDNVNIKMTPGTYSIGPDDVTSGLLPNPDILEFTGSNCTYDFTDVTIQFDTDIFLSYGNTNVTEIRLAGANNVLKNLTMEDIGDTRPYRTALGIKFDGVDNRIEGFHMTVRGSYPYGYGDIFGKGSGYVIKHFKHSAVLIRGERNHLKNCTIIHRAYGHGIFCQGSKDALIEGCHLEGEVRTTDDVLAEEGTGSPADQEGFITVWEHRLEPGWTFSLQEDGIRAYNNGAHHITGETTNTENMRVIDCTIDKMRSGVTIGFCDGEKYVENCTAVGTEGGFWVGNNGEVVNSRGDGAYGPLYATSYDKDKGAKVDLTVIDSDYTKHGTHPLVFLGGSGHNVYVKSEETIQDPNHKIMVAGVREGMRYGPTSHPQYFDQPASDVKLSNATGYPVILEARCENGLIQSCGSVTDDGTNNTVTIFEDCSEVNPNNLCPKTAELMEAECNDGMSGVQTENSSEGGMNVGWIDHGDWLLFEGIDLTGKRSIEARVASKYSGGTIEVRLGTTSGTLIATVPVPNTGNWQSWISSTVDLDITQNGTFDVYFVFKGTRSGSLFNVNWLSFSEASLSTSTLTLSDSISVFPNPANDILNVSLENSVLNLDNIKFGLYALNGQKLMEEKPKAGSKTVSLNLSKLNAGVYLLRIENEQITLTKRIVKL